MIPGFIIWSSVCVLILGIGVWSWRSDKPAGFYAGVKPPEVKDVRKYNHAVGMLWFVYAVLFELLGLPFLFLEQNAAGFLLPVFGTMGITIGLLVAYQRILRRFQ